MRISRFATNGVCRSTYHLYQYLYEWWLGGAHNLAHAARNDTFRQHVLLTTVANIVLAALGVITGVLVARLLGPIGRGELAAIQLWPAFIVSLGTLGLSEAIVYFAAKDEDSIGRYVTRATMLAFFGSFPFVAIGYFLLPVVLAGHSPEVISAARWYLLSGPIIALLDIPFHALRACRDFVSWNALRLASAAGWLGVLGYAALASRAEPAFIAGAYVVLLAVLCLAVMYIVGRRVPGPFQPGLRHAGPMLRYGLMCHANGLTQACGVRLDQLLIAAFLPVEALGLYVVAVSWGSGLHPWSSAFGAVLFPEIAARKEQRNREALLLEGSRSGGAVTLVCGLLALAVTPWAVPLLFGESFTAAVPAALLMVVAGTVSGLGQVLEGGIRGMGTPALILRAELGRFVVTALSLWLLLGPFGITGAALASLAGSSVFLVALLSQARRVDRSALPVEALLTRSEARREEVGSPRLA